MFNTEKTGTAPARIDASHNTQEITGQDLPEKEYKPKAQLIHLDLDFAKMGTLMKLFNIVTSFFISEEDRSDSSKRTVAKSLDDIFHKIRQICQYSIHAQPGLGRKPDDIASDMVHNMEAAALGREVYTFNAFVAPWLGLFKIFFPYSHSPIWGLIPRMADFADNTIGKMTNMFWNLRRITKSLIPYDGGITSDTLVEKQNQVRDLMSFWWNFYIRRPINAIKSLIFKSRETQVDMEFERAIRNQSSENIRKFTKQSVKDYMNNLKALFSEKYQCPHDDTKKSVGFEEPENNKIYVRSKIASQLWGLWAGGLGSLFNGVGIVSNLFGSLFNNARLRLFSDKMTDQANALMSLVYLTGEVPANINEALKKMKSGDSKLKGTIAWNFAVSVIGAIGMVNRLKVNPVFSFLFNAIKIKPLLDKFDSQLRHFFLLFFSSNRLVMHEDEIRQALDNSSYRDIVITGKHENPLKLLILPFRVIARDKDVTYDNIATI